MKQKFSKIKKSKEIASLIMNNAINLNSELKELDKEYEEFVNELNKCFQRTPYFTFLKKSIFSRTVLELEHGAIIINP